MDWIINNILIKKLW